MDPTPLSSYDIGELTGPLEACVVIKLSEMRQPELFSVPLQPFEGVLRADLHSGQAWASRPCKERAVSIENNGPLRILRYSITPKQSIST